MAPGPEPGGPARVAGEGEAEQRQTGQLLGEARVRALRVGIGVAETLPAVTARVTVEDGDAVSTLRGQVGDPHHVGAIDRGVTVHQTIAGARQVHLVQDASHAVRAGRHGVCRDAHVLVPVIAEQVAGKRVVHGMVMATEC